MPRPDDPPPDLPGGVPPRARRSSAGPDAAPRPSVRSTMLRVLLVQAVTLAILGLLQWGFGG